MQPILKLLSHAATGSANSSPFHSFESTSWWRGQDWKVFSWKFLSCSCYPTPESGPVLTITQVPRSKYPAAWDHPSSTNLEVCAPP
jgi:hypothetical protein